MPHTSINIVNSLVGRLGQRVIKSVYYLIDLTVFIQQALSDWRERRKRLLNRTTRRALTTQILFTGIDASLAVTILALAIGISVTSQIIHLTSGFTSQGDIIGVLVYLIGYEFGPLLTAVLIIGRSGSAMVVDLGNMKLRGEIESLELLAISVNDYFVLPRLLATAISQLVLAVYFSGMALYSGVIFSGFMYSSSYFLYLDSLLTAFPPILLSLFVIKNIIFGLIIAGVACFHALKVKHSTTELPQQTQKSIVNSLTIIFIIDGILAFAAQFS